MRLVRRSTLAAGIATLATVFGVAVAPTAGAVVLPKVTAVAPTSGYTAGGTRVTVSGSGFSQVAAVYFGASKGSAIKVLSTGKLTVTAPPHVDGRVDVRVKTAAGESAIVAADHYTYKPTPVSGVTVLGVTDSSAALSWVNPRDPYLGQIVVRRSADGSAILPTPTTGVLVATLPKTATSATSTGLKSASTYAFAVFARDTNGHYAAAAGRTTRTIQWGAPSLTDPSQGFPTALSCAPGTTHCALVDQLGTAMAFSGSWQNPQKLSLSHVLTGVSCVSQTFCLAVGNGGFAATFDPTESSSPVAINTGETSDFTGASCVTTTFCVAVDNAGAASIYDGSTWVTTSVDTPPFALSAVSCVTTTFCVAVDTAGTAFVYKGTWSLSYPMVDPGALVSVSCATTTMCVAMSESAKAALYNGTSWGESSVPTLQSGGPVSCATSTFCLASDLFGNTEEFNGSSWGTLAQMCPGSVCNLSITGVACPVSGSCIAIDANSGEYRTYGAGAWTDPSAGDVTSFPGGVACPATSFCMLTDAGGKAFRYNGVAWDGGTQAAGTFGTVSCPVAGSCQAVADLGVAAFAGNTWGPASNLESPFDRSAVADVSCASTSFCGAADSKGRVTFFNGTKWSSLGTIDLDSLNAISCSAPRLCVAVDSAGRPLNFNGTTWSNPTYADTYNRVTRVSCVGTSFCAAVDDAGNALYFNGSTWSALSNIAGSSPLLSVSCVSTRFCYATTASTVVGFGPGLAAVATSLPANGQLVQITCNAAPMCMAIDFQGETFKVA